jgi:DNA polymerase III gamma/tau subunit
VEMGYDLRLVCRELARVVRDLLVLSVDPSRASDPEIAGDADRERLLDLAKRFSREDLLRSFDLLTRAESDIRNAAQPRYHLEMALLRWIYLRKLTPIEDLIQSAGGSQGAARTFASASGSSRQRPAELPPPSDPSRSVAQPPRPAAASPLMARAQAAASAPAGSGSIRSSEAAPPASRAADASAPSAVSPVASGNLKDALLTEIRKANPVLYNTLIAQAQTLEVRDDRVVLTFAASQKIGPTFDKYRPVLETLATRLAGRKVTVVAETSAAAPSQAGAESGARVQDADRKLALKEQALADAGVQALLEVFPAEIRDVEEM